MKIEWMNLPLCLALLIPLAARAGVDLSSLDENMVGPRTEILVLGTVHLSEQKDFDAKALEPALDKLAAFKPAFITTEDISGEQCDLAVRHATVYGDDYCASTEVARAATGLEIPAAIAAINTTLAAWPAKPAPADRRHLAALFLAAGERPSAYVQWLQLPPGEQRTGADVEGT